MCDECRHRRYTQALEAYKNLSEQYSFIDEHDNGRGWWSSVEQQVRILARREAWKRIGYKNTWLGHYTFTPDVAMKIGDNLKLLPCVGPTTVNRLKTLTDKDVVLWKNVYRVLYDDKNSFEWRFAASNFNRVKNRTNRRDNDYENS